MLIISGPSSAVNAQQGRCGVPRRQRRAAIGFESRLRTMVYDIIREIVTGKQTAGRVPSVATWTEIRQRYDGSDDELRAELNAECKAKRIGWCRGLNVRMFYLR